MQEEEIRDKRQDSRSFLLPILMVIVVLVVMALIYLFSRYGYSSCSGSGTLTTGGAIPSARQCTYSLNVGVMRLVYSWPVHLAGAFLILGGLIARRKWALFSGAVVAVPACFYLAGYPITYWIPASFPFFVLWAAELVSRDQIARAYIISIPALLVLFLFSIVMFFANYL